MPGPVMRGLIRAGKDPLDPPELICMTFDMYLDESCDPKRERLFAVGGLSAEEHVWTKFELRWLSRTHELRKPFRSTECECQQRQFATWKKSDCDQLMADLVGLILEYPISGLGWIVPIPDYASITGNAGEYEGYFLGLKCVFITAAHLAEAFGSNIRFWVEENRATASRAAQIYHDIKGIKGWRPVRRMAGVSFLGKSIVGLQAADLVARERFKFIDNRGTSRGIRKPVWRMEPRITINAWTAPSLKSFWDKGGTDRVLIEYLAGHLFTPPIKLNKVNY